MAGSMNLLCPEWQAGTCPEAYQAASGLAAAVFEQRGYVVIDAPESEALTQREGVNGLDSIVPRIARTLEVLGRVRPERLFMIGGTCGTAAAPLAYLNERYAGDLAVVWFDAHGDLNTPQTSPSGNFNGIVLRTLLGDGPSAMVSRIARPLLPEQVFLVGARDLDAGELEYLAAHPVTHVPQVTTQTTRALVEAIRAAGYRRVYLHLDVDVCDPGKFSSALMPTPGGVDPGALADCLAALLMAFEIAGVGVVEFRGTTPESRAQLLALLQRAGLNP